MLFISQPAIYDRNRKIWTKTSIVSATFVRARGDDIVSTGWRRPLTDKKAGRAVMIGGIVSLLNYSPPDT